MSIIELSLCKKTVCLFVCVVFSVVCAAQKIMLKTNALYWGALAPNAGVELRMSRHITLNVEAQGSMAKFGDNKKTKFFALTPEARYWFSGRPQAHHFVGIMGVGTAYDVVLNKNDHRGYALGAGVTYGYSFVLGKHWSFEATAGAGLVSYEEKRWPAKTEMPTEPNVKDTKLMPLKLGLNMVYVF